MIPSCIFSRIHYIEKGSTWGSWNVKWTLETNQLLSPPTIARNKLILHVTEVIILTRSKTLNLAQLFFWKRNELKTIIVLHKFIKIARVKFFSFERFRGLTLECSALRKSIKYFIKTSLISSLFFRFRVAKLFFSKLKKNVIE